MKIVFRILGYVRPYLWWMVLAAVGMVAMVTLNMVIAWLTKRVIDEALIMEQHHLLVPLSLSVVGVAAVRGVAAFLQRYSMEYVAQHVIYDMRSQLYQHLQRLSFSYYDNMRTGQLMARVTGDVEMLRRVIGFGIISLLSNVFRFIIVLVLVLSLHWRLALVSMILMPLLVFTVLQFSSKVRPAYRDIQAQLATLTSTLQENVTGVRVVRAFAQEEVEKDGFKEENYEYFRKEIRATKLMAFYFPLINFLSQMATVVVVSYGGIEVMQGRLSVGELVAFNAYLLMLIMPLRMVGWIVNMYQRGIASGERIFEILDEPILIREKPNARELESIEGHVRLEDIYFTYPDSSKPVLVDINIEARPGQVIALLGGTGSGKSTLVSLIPRFHDPSSGRVLIDGYDARDMTLPSLRQQVGVVMQDTFLFSASIGDNIRYGRPEATQEEVEQAARAARMHDFIMTLPDGYETLVGERGMGLSGGQKQRVAIARTLLINPAILILDDATSSVDTETEHMIQQALATLMEKRTTFVISQRLSSIKDADEIIVLEDGHVAQRGTHEELMKTGPRYQEIYQLQVEDSSANIDPQFGSDMI